ncbi:MAG: hypothetical protein PVI15_09310 [Chromatiales bacterium]|jgi:hypothetical protein
MLTKIKNLPLFILGVIVLLVWLGLLLLGQEWVNQVHPTMALLTPALLIAGLFMLYQATK